MVSPWAQRDDAYTRWRAANHEHPNQSDDHRSTPEGIQELRLLVDETQQDLDRVQDRLTALCAEPAVANRPDAAISLANQHTECHGDREHRDRAEQLTSLRARRAQIARPSGSTTYAYDRGPQRTPDRGVPR